MPYCTGTVNPVLNATSSGFSDNLPLNKAFSIRTLDLSYPFTTAIGGKQMYHGSILLAVKKHAAKK